MKLIKYTYELANQCHPLYNRYADYTYHYPREDLAIVTLAVRVSGKDLYVKAEEPSYIPEHYVRKKLEDKILQEIRKELFGS